MLSSLHTKNETSKTKQLTRQKNNKAINKTIKRDELNKQTKQTRKTLSEELNCSVSTLRKYEREFAKWLKTPAGERGQGKTRKYLEEDIHTLSAIHALRLKGVSFAKLKAGELDKVLDSKTWTHEPEAFQPEDAQDEQPQANALVSMEQHVALMGKYQATEGELKAVAAERDRLLEQTERLAERLLDAEKSASHAEGELAAYKSSWWRNLFKKGE